MLRRPHWRTWIGILIVLVLGWWIHDVLFTALRRVTAPIRSQSKYLTLYNTLPKVAKCLNDPYTMHPKEVFLSVIPEYPSKPFSFRPLLDTIHIVTVAVPVTDQDVMVELAIQLLQSVDTFARRNPIQFHVVTNALGRAQFHKDPWLNTLTIQYHDPNLEADWKPLFRPYSAQRLFLHRLLPELDRVIYLDADTLVTRDVADLWEWFEHMSPHHTIAATRESEILDGFYLRVSDPRLPFVGYTGINAGVLLLHLDRQRHSDSSWDADMARILFHYQELLWLGDQDVLNVWGAQHPESVMLLPCVWNVREDSWCRFARPGDLGIVHGNRGTLDGHRHADHWIYGMSNFIRHHPFQHAPWHYQYGKFMSRIV